MVKYWFKTKYEMRSNIQRAWYNTSLDTQSSNKVVLWKRAYMTCIYNQLKSGHAIKGTFLKVIGKKDSD